jgi:hypothetical protein
MSGAGVEWLTRPIQMIEKEMLTPEEAAIRKLTKEEEDWVKEASDEVALQISRQFTPRQQTVLFELSQVPSYFAFLELKRRVYEKGWTWDLPDRLPRFLVNGMLKPQKRISAEKRAWWQLPIPSGNSRG